MREITRDALERAEGVVRVIGTINLIPEDWTRAQEHLQQLGFAMQSRDELQFNEACVGLERPDSDRVKGNGQGMGAKFDP